MKTSNSYAFVLHEQFENYQQGSAVDDDKSEPLEDLECSPASNNANGGMTVTPPGQSDNLIDFLGITGGLATATAVLAENRYAEAFAESIKLAKEFAATNNTTAFPDSDNPSSWMAAVSATKAAYNANPKNSNDYRMNRPDIAVGTSPNPSAETTHQLFTFTFKYKRYFKVYHYTGDHYEQNGYQGVGKTDVYEGYGPGEYVTYYTYAAPG